MLDIVLSATDDLPVVKLSFEHSLVSMSKWESFYKKPFFGREPKTEEEAAFYIRQMLLNEDPPANFLDRLGIEEFKKIADYIDSTPSATTFAMDNEKSTSRETITSELIYYWLVQFQIPFQPTETWHVNRIITLIKVAGIKQSKPKKMSKQQLAEQYREMNAKRRQELGTAG